jgi:hypothetical protein
MKDYVIILKIESICKGIFLLFQMQEMQENNNKYTRPQQFLSLCLELIFVPICLALEIGWCTNLMLVQYL